MLILLLCVVSWVEKQWKMKIRLKQKSSGKLNINFFIFWNWEIWQKGYLHILEENQCSDFTFCFAPLLYGFVVSHLDYLSKEWPQRPWVFPFISQALHVTAQEQILTVSSLSAVPFSLILNSLLKNKRTKSTDALLHSCSWIPVF